MSEHRARTAADRRRRVGRERRCPPGEPPRRGRAPAAHFDRVPDIARFGIFIAARRAIPLFTSDEYILRVSVDTLIFALLALGLNVVVGWAGLLDLGYVAFFGIGAYGYALLSSDHFGHPLEAQFTVPIIVAGTALVGLLLGLPSWRLLGDYLAIVTLFFLQAFVVVTTNGNSISFLGMTPRSISPAARTGSLGSTRFTIFGYRSTRCEGYFYLALVTMALVMAMLYLAVRVAHRPRLARAPRGLAGGRADEHAGEPAQAARLRVRRGHRRSDRHDQAALVGGVFPTSYDVPLLIMIYAMLILGGVGSLAGAVARRDHDQRLAGGAARPRSCALALLLGDPDHARGEAAALAEAGSRARLARRLRLCRSRDRRRALAVGDRRRGGGRRRDRPRRAELGRSIPPSTRRRSATTGSWLLIALVLLLTVIKDPWRTVLLVPTLYLAAFVWENLLMASFEAQAATRFMLLGALLVVLMAARPQGLVGQPRVEVASSERTRRARAAQGEQVVRRAARARRARPRRRRARDRQRDRPERRRQDDASSTSSPASTRPTRATSSSTARASPASPRYRITKRGIARTFQTLRLFLNMTVKENVMAAAYGHTRANVFQSILRTPAARREEREIARLAEEKLAFFGQRLVGYRWDQPAYCLSYANRRRLEIARATATKPRCSCSTSRPQA